MNSFPISSHVSFPQNSTVKSTEQNNLNPEENTDKKKPDPVISGAPSAATLQRNKTLPRFVAEALPQVPHTGVNINGKNIQPGPDTPPVVAKFIEQTLQNGAYDSPEHLRLRAENFFEHMDAERAINEKTREAMKQPESPIARQSAHMAHLLRGLWAKAEFTAEVREQLGKDFEQSDASKRELIDKSAHLFGPAKDVHAMFARAEQGPLTFEQSKYGVETAYALRAVIGGKKTDNSKITSHSKLFSEFNDYATENWVSPDRAGTHHLKEGGVSLKQDLGSQIRDKLGLPVMLGTSGSSSDITMAIKFASAKQKASMWPSDLTEEEGKQALIDATHHYMREQVTPISMKGAYNKLRIRLGAEPKDVEPFMVFSHNYAEVSSAIEMTLNREGEEKNEAMEREAMERVSIQARDRLRNVKDELDRKRDGGGQA